MLRGKHMAEHGLADTLQVGTVSDGGYGSAPSARSWAWAGSIACSVDTSKSREVSDGSQATITDAVISVPLGTAITSQQRVKVTHRFRAALATAEIYEVIGAPKNGRSIMELNCKRVTGNVVT